MTTGLLENHLNILGSPYWRLQVDYFKKSQFFGHLNLQGSGLGSRFQRVLGVALEGLGFRKLRP